MRTFGWFANDSERVEDSFEYKLEWLELTVTERILAVMERKNVSRADLARKIGVSKAAVSKLLNHGSNMTLKRLLAISEALDYDVDILLKRRSKSVDHGVLDFKPRKSSFSFVREVPADDYSHGDARVRHV